MIDNNSNDDNIDINHNNNNNDNMYILVYIYIYMAPSSPGCARAATAPPRQAINRLSFTSGCRVCPISLRLSLLGLMDSNFLRNSSLGLGIPPLEN